MLAQIPATPNEPWHRDPKQRYWQWYATFRLLQVHSSQHVTYRVACAAEESCSKEGWQAERRQRKGQGPGSIWRGQHSHWKGGRQSQCGEEQCASFQADQGDFKAFVFCTQRPACVQ